MNHARRVQADADRHQRAQEKAHEDADPKPQPGEPERVSGQPEVAALEIHHDEQHGGHGSAVPIPICTERRGKRATRPAPSHAPATEATINEINVTGSTATIDDEDRRFDDRRQRVPDVERSRNLLVGNEAQNLKSDVVGRERADAERVEEVRDEADPDGDRAGNWPRQRETLTRQRAPRAPRSGRSPRRQGRCREASGELTRQTVRAERAAACNAARLRLICRPFSGRSRS